ncbi:MAG TPA: hypothetical protein PK513_03735 [Alphaproteobacteria bacterium]|nr:hypothetical protein [Alphaproteobacteria bacterium]USO06365.1 MAG: hypothetical protein H6859_04040 [Rhodospirillales bacterium]HOO81594.1 hypothetical protein [Alphaproteobacteria bacterium]
MTVNYEKAENKAGDNDAEAVVETVTEVAAGAVTVSVPAGGALVSAFKDVDNLPLNLIKKMGSKRLPWLLGTAATAGFVVDEVEAHWEKGDVCKAFGAALAGIAETGGNFVPGGNYLLLGDTFHKTVRTAYIGVTEGVLGFEEGQCTPNETDIVAAVDYLSSDGAPRMVMNINDEKLAP